jgi:hypothetical protein
MIKALPIEINWNPNLSFFASERSLKEACYEYEWPYER